MCYQEQILSLKTYVHTPAHTHVHMYVGPISQATAGSAVLNQIPPMTGNIKETWAVTKTRVGV